MAEKTETPIMSLPPEIFAEIFGQVAHDAHAAYLRSLRHEALQTDPQLPCPYSWITLTHVCRVWRWIALSTPLLWSNISVLNGDATDVFLARSGKSDLTLTFRLPLNRDDLSLTVEQSEERIDIYATIIEDEIHRITSMTVPALLEFFELDAVAGATKLRFITMISPNHGFRVYHTGAEPFPFPCLECLEYRAPGKRPYHRLFCRTLKTLILQPYWQDMHPDDEPEVYLPSARELVGALSCMPHLEELDVHLADEVETITFTASLSRLRKLRVIGPTAACARLFAHISIPLDARIDFDCRLPDDGESFAVVPLMYVVVEMLSGACVRPSTVPSSFAPVSAFSIEDTDGYYALHGWRSAPAPLALASASANAKADAEIAVSCVWFDPHDALHALLAPFASFSCVTTVRIGRLPSHLEGTLEGAAALCALPKLEVLVVDGLRVPYVLDLVGRTTAREVVLARISFCPTDPAKAAQWLYSWSSGRMPVTADEPASMEDLAEVLRKRKREDKPFCVMRILDSKNVRPKDVNALKDYVDELEWDGLQEDELNPADVEE